MKDSSVKQPVSHKGVWRKPDAESEDYPGLVVHDGRVTGSITAGHSRLPLWCLIHTALTEGWEAVEGNWSPSLYGWDQYRLGEFLYSLLEARGEFGRLICILADVERDERERIEKADAEGIVSDTLLPSWWNVPEQRQRMIDQLRLCLEALESAM